MTKAKNKIAALTLAGVISLSLTALPSAAIGSENYERENIFVSRVVDGREYRVVLGINNKNTWNYARQNVSINGQKLSVQGIKINGTYYIPSRAAANALGASYSYNSSTKTATMRGKGLVMTMSANCYVSYANDRVLFSITPNVIMSDGRMYVPADVFSKAVGMSVAATDSAVNISGAYTPLEHGSAYYREDEVFWLGRIIHAEASGEPLLGKIAVGNVVMNRVKSPYYPNTIYGVIFDRKYGVQFSPIIDGAIYNTPSYNSTIAAKICLEGYNISEGAFFFLEPRLATSSWIPTSREYAFTIGNHDFYK